jgi:hypothetical protein|tara:strand:+ start:765 stop:887 length:123 start_codon:yes stop_codon:yes gene_type:complete
MVMFGLTTSPSDGASQNGLVVLADKNNRDRFYHTAANELI